MTQVHAQSLLGRGRVETNGWLASRYSNLRERERERELVGARPRY